MADIPDGYAHLLDQPVYGHLATVPDPTGAFYLELNDRYSGPLTEPPPDKADRVILVVRPTGYTKQ